MNRRADVHLGCQQRWHSCCAAIAASTRIYATESAILEHVKRHPGLPRPPELAGNYQRIARYSVGASLAGGH